MPEKFDEYPFNFDPDSLIDQFITQNFNSVNELNKEYQKIYQIFIKNNDACDLQYFYFLYSIYKFHLNKFINKDNSIFSQTFILQPSDLSEIIEKVENMITNAYIKNLIEILIQNDFNDLRSLKKIYATILSNLLKSQVPLNFLEIYLTFYLEPIFLGKLRAILTSKTNFEH